MSARGWHAAVAASAAVVTVVVLALGAGWLASLHSKTTTYAVAAPLSRIELTSSSGDVLIVGTQASTLEVRRTDDYSFGHPAREQRSFTNGILRISSQCPKIVLGSCSASYEVAVPETVTVSVRTTEGNVRLTGFRGTADVQTTEGNVNVDAYCGFDLAARTRSGNVRIAAACSPERLDVQTRTGDATALVPPARYRISASAGDGPPHVSGVIRDASVPFSIDMHSEAGRVTIGGGL